MGSVPPRPLSQRAATGGPVAVRWRAAWAGCAAALRPATHLNRKPVKRKVTGTFTHPDDPPSNPQSKPKKAATVPVPGEPPFRRLRGAAGGRIGSAASGRQSLARKSARGDRPEAVSPGQTGPVRPRWAAGGAKGMAVGRARGQDSPAGQGLACGPPRPQQSAESLIGGTLSRLPSAPKPRASAP